jgi:hypothetical protein
VIDMANIVRKPIVFNLDDPLQKKLYDHAMQHKNFSYYGKSLVQRDFDDAERTRRRSGNGVKLDLRDTQEQKYYR